MTLADYFESAEGTGILATSDAAGRVDAAVYAKPLVVDEATVAFVMKERLSHQNLRSNLHAAYMFIEKGEGYRGRRLTLTLEREEINLSLVEAMRKKQPKMFPREDDSHKYVVFFHVEGVRPLVGDFAEE